MLVLTGGSLKLSPRMDILWAKTGFLPIRLRYEGRRFSALTVVTRRGVRYNRGRLAWGVRDAQLAPPARDSSFLRRCAMSSKHHWLWIVPAAVLALAAAFWYRTRTFEPSSGAATPVRVLLVTGGPGDYWDDVVRGAHAAADKYKVDLDVKSPADNENPSQQAEILSQTDFKKIDGLGLSPLDAEGQAALINRIAQITKVITFDSDAPQTNRMTFVGTNNYGAGHLAARLTREALPEGGKIALLVVNRTKDNIQDRMSGFSETLAAVVDNSPKIEIVDVLEDQGQADQCAENIRKALDDHPDLAGFVAMNGFHGPILIKTLRANGKLGKVKLVTFDDAPETIAGVEDGGIFATVVQDPFHFGYETVRILADFSRGDELLKPIASSAYNVSPVAVKRENLDEFRKRAEARK
jgi:ribose transport system substrate-binding protein